MEVACLMIDNETTRVRVQRHAARSVITVEYSANLPIRQTEACASYVTMMTKPSGMSLSAQFYHYLRSSLTVIAILVMASISIQTAMLANRLRSLQMLE